MSSGYVAVGTRLVGRPETLDEVFSRPDAEPGHPWDEQVPPPGRDATLLAVVPIPGTGTSLAIVGYAIATSSRHAAPQAAPHEPAPPIRSGHRDAVPMAVFALITCSAGSGRAAARSC